MGTTKYFEIRGKGMQDLEVLNTASTYTDSTLNTHGYVKLDSHCVKSYLKRKTKYPYRATILKHWMVIIYIYFKYTDCIFHYW